MTATTANSNPSEMTLWANFEGTNAVVNCEGIDQRSNGDGDSIRHCRLALLRQCGRGGTVPTALRPASGGEGGVATVAVPPTAVPVLPTESSLLLSLLLPFVPQGLSIRAQSIANIRDFHSATNPCHSH